MPTGLLRSHVQRRKEKPFLIIETVPVAIELHMFSDVTWHWLWKPEARSQGNPCSCPPEEGRPIADKEVFCYQNEHGKSVLRLQEDGILGWEINTPLQSWAVPDDWVTRAL